MRGRSLTEEKVFRFEDIDGCVTSGVLLTVNLFTIFHNEVQLRHLQKF